MEYDIPRGCLGAYYPETNPLVPLSSVADGAGTPTSKSIPVLLSPAKSVTNAAVTDEVMAAAINRRIEPVMPVIRGTGDGRREVLPYLPEEPEMDN